MSSSRSRKYQQSAPSSKTRSRYRATSASISEQHDTNNYDNTQQTRPSSYQNIMYDRRIIRGSTYALRQSIASRIEDEESQSISHSRKLHNESMRARQASRRRHRQGDPSTIASKTNTRDRVSISLQTEKYLEEIPIEPARNFANTQTDPFLDRPSTPLFSRGAGIHGPQGISTGTQVDIDELFDFDKEIEPLLEILTGKTIEQSLMEVLEEEELKRFTKYREEVEQKKNIVTFPFHLCQKYWKRGNFRCFCDKRKNGEKKKEKMNKQKLGSSKMPKIGGRTKKKGRRKTEEDCCFFGKRESGESIEKES